MSFVGIFAKFQLGFSVFAVMTFAALAWIEGSWWDAIPGLGGLTGNMLGGLFIAFWIVSAVFGWIIILGLLMLMAVKQYRPFSGTNITFLLGMLVVTSFPLLNIFTIFLAAAWILALMWKKVKRA